MEVDQMDADEFFTYMRARALPVSAIGDARVREAMRITGIILGYRHDAADTRHHTILHGIELIEDIGKGAGRYGEWGPQNVMAFVLNFDTDDLEILYAAIETLKGPGSCCYKPGTGRVPRGTRP